MPRTFLAFCAAIAVTLTLGQAELARVAFDGAEPLDRGLAARLFGAGDLPLGARRVVAAVCGARAGKTYVLVALRLVWGMLVRDVPPLPPGTKAVALILAPRSSMRMEAYRYALGAVMSTPWLADMLVGEPKAEEFTLRRPDGQEITLECGVATAGGTAARGRWFTDFALDECAFFRDDSFKVNDQEIFRAAFARLLPGGQAIIASTPWAEAGLLYDLWKERPANTLVVHAPTLVLHDTPVTREVVQHAQIQDPDNARREFGAEFMTQGTTLFFESSTIDAACTSEPFTPEPHDAIAAGADLGFRSDSSALVMVALRGSEVHVFDGRELRPGPLAPLSTELTFDTFAELMKGRCGHVMADGHYQVAMIEAMHRQGLNVIPAPAVPSATYVRARQLLRSLRVKIHPLPFRDRLVKQLREVHGKPSSGGGMSISHPRWATGGHGDIADAFVLALWQVSGDEVAEQPPAVGTKEWEMEQKIARYNAIQEEENRPRYMAKGGGVGRAHRRL